MRRRTGFGLLCALICAVPLASCGRTQPPLVLAASSLGSTLESSTADGAPAMSVSAAGTATLVAQVAAGAPADVMIVANDDHRDAVLELHPGATATAIARNRLSIVTPAGNPAGIEAITDIEHARTLVVCEETVPCGNATRDFASAAHLSLHPVSQELSVRDVLSKVTAGIADAGVVYRTDARAAGDAVHVIHIPDELSPTNTYYVIDLPGPHHDAAVVAYLMSPDFAARLRAAGFEPPPHE